VTLLRLRGDTLAGIERCFFAMNNLVGMVASSFVAILGCAGEASFAFETFGSFFFSILCLLGWPIFPFGAGCFLFLIAVFGTLVI
jgi:hypothetical protein